MAILCALSQGQNVPLEPWASTKHPTDEAKRHVQDITEARQEYVVVQGGTMDGLNCRSPQGCWTPFEQTWESNRSVRLENVGEADVVNPWLSNGRNTFRSLAEIVASAVEPGMSEREKAFALWWQQTRYRYHWPGDNNEVGEPVRIFNVYGHNTCGNDSIALAGLWRQAGFKVTPARLVGHCVSQVFYDGGWHLMDGDMHSVYLLRDNETVASEKDLVNDKDLIRRTHTQGILHQDRRASDEWESSIYVYEGDASGDRRCREDGTMDMKLRPGEALTWRWGRLNPVKYHGPSTHKYPDRICNGLWEYRPDFANDRWRKGADTIEGVLDGPEGLSAEGGKAALVQWTVRTPYVLVGGRLEAEGEGTEFSISVDGKTWTDVQVGSVDSLFPSAGPAFYKYSVRCRLSGSARLKRLALVNDLQMAPLALPEMSVGKNSFTYTDSSPSGRRVRITHDWVERSASRPPDAPPAPVYPPDGGEAEGTDLVFAWKAPADAIADYHFELSARPDLKWPLSMSFAKLNSRTADAGKPRYTTPAPGLLTPDRTYYWRVRAKDPAGVWGPWSKTWTFTPRAPAPPLQVTLEAGTLRWKANPVGRKPRTYRVYASDEKGFSVSDQPYPATVGVTKDVPSTFPANFVAETEALELRVTGKAFYRVVAVDALGKRSGPSDYASAPRPLVYSRPPETAKVGTEYRYAPASIRSLGDLRMRVIKGKETLGFWDIEKPRVALVKGPRWLSVDEATGALFGIPDAAGKVEVEISVALEREQRRLDGDALKWGVEKVVSSAVEKIGSATQKFTIDVR